jgi:hypothetical protein
MAKNSIAMAAPINIERSQALCLREQARGRAGEFLPALGAETGREVAR